MLKLKERYKMWYIITRQYELMLIQMREAIAYGEVKTKW